MTCAGRISNAPDRSVVLLLVSALAQPEDRAERLAELPVFPHSHSLKKQLSKAERPQDTYYFLQSKKQTVCMNKGLINEISRFTVAKF